MYRSDRVALAMRNDEEHARPHGPPRKTAGRRPAPEAVRNNGD